MAPFSQINWWLPVYEFSPDNGMAFHPQFWDSAVPNTSDTYNYYEWNRTSRRNAASHIKADYASPAARTRFLSHPIHNCASWLTLEV